MAEGRPDRRVERTQLSLHRAQLALVLEKGYTKTTVKDIVDRANVGRSTFYAHHGSKETLLLSGLSHLRLALLASQREGSAAGAGARRRPLAFSRVFFEHVHEYRVVFRALLASEAAPALTRGLERLLGDVVRRELGGDRAGARDRGTIRSAAVHFAVDALLSVLFWWLDHAPNLSSSEIDTIFHRLMQKPLEVLESG